MDLANSIGTEPMTCFIVGIAPRSGTNYLYSLLNRHPECFSGSFGEIMLLRHSALLVAYAERVVATWSQKWVVSGEVDEDGLLGNLGTGLVNWLRRRQAALTLATEPDAASTSKKLFLIKTPDVRGLQHFTRLFPDARTILLVRDGRAIVESGVRSFDWRYERAMQQWAMAASTVLNFMRDHAGSDNTIVLMRYEDLVADEETELNRIFRFLNLDPRLYDFDAAAAMGVIGSSESRGDSGRVHWKEVAKRGDFDPLHRFEGWSRRRRARFAWVAGRQMTALGYDLDTAVPSDWLSRVWHGVLDIGWQLEQRALTLARLIVWPLVVAAKRRSRSELSRRAD